ncbi:MAG: T9SS type A sorting domain-containing protein [Bacteroidetes bacterium]|nr:T9SS type A sorting domain-containing protein [Bacteroidota bacterium]
MGNIVRVFFAILLLSCFSASSLFSQINTGHEDQKYSKVRIYVTSSADIKRIQNAGLALEDGIHKDGKYHETWLSSQDISILKSTGVPYEIIIDDWMEYYNNLPKMSSAEFRQAIEKSQNEYGVSHNIMGSMGGFLKRQEVINKLDSMRLQYPNLVSAKWSIGMTYENREIWCVRATKNPDAPTGRPEVFIYGLTHAREPTGMESLIYYMYWLFENYNIDPLATYILNNREIYFVPIYNGDGYYYNETSNPTGGGMWRKNRKPCSGGYGTDLNRNYGIYSYWNSSNGGSSTSCSSDTYRGTSPNSEPETQVFENFVNSRNFKSGISFHTYGNHLIKPWAWCDPTPTPDDAVFNEWGLDMNQYNHYNYGTCYQLLSYYSRGDALDWMYNDSAHSHIIAFTSEVGSDFWPPQSEIMPDVQANLWMCQYISMAAGPFVNNKSVTFNKQTYTQNETGNVKIVFRNKGRMDASNIKVEFMPMSSYITIPTQVYTKASMPSFTSDSVTFNFTISGSAPNMYAVPTRIRLKQNDTNIVYDQVYNVLIGTGVTTFADSAENGTSNWTFGTGWGINTTNYHTPTHSFAYPNYGISVNNSMSLNFPLNLSAYPVAYLQYWHRYDVESGYDFCYVELSSNNGSTWQQVSAYSGTNNTWTQQVFDVTSMIGGSNNVRVRFRLTSDAGVQNTGWYVDDIKITNYYGPVTGVGNLNPELPAKFSLEQNYPNPFNPSTQINYALPKDGFAKITVFDILGREVRTLVSEFKKAGYYSVEFDGSSLSSGFYFYKLESNGFVETKKMMLVK